MNRVRRSLTLTALLALSGCSFLAVQGPPEPLPKGEFECTVAPEGAIVLDILAGSLLGIAVGVLNRADFCHDGQNCGRGSVGGSVAKGALVALPFYLSAYVGAKRSSRCRAAIDEREREAGLPVAPPME